MARQTDRRVWVRISQRYCNPCHLLNRWIDDHKETLDKDFVMLKIDDVRDRFGTELAQEITAGRNYGVPFFAFYDAEETKLIDSCDANGNIGFMSGFEGKRHFRRMLELARRSLTDAEIEQLLSSLEE